MGNLLVVLVVALVIAVVISLVLIYKWPDKATREKRRQQRAEQPESGIRAGHNKKSQEKAMMESGSLSKEEIDEVLFSNNKKRKQEK